MNNGYIGFVQHVKLWIAAGFQQLRSNILLPIVDPMDEIRDRVRERMQELGLSKRAVSLQIKRGETYMHDWLEGKSRGEIPDALRAPLAEILKMQPEDLGVAPWRVQQPPPHGMSEDAERYYPTAPTAIVQGLADMMAQPHMPRSAK